MPTKRTLLTAALAAACLLPAAPASARIIEIGETASRNDPSCPGNPCLAISRTTGYQTRVGAERDVFVVPRDGRIVAWTISLGKPGKKQRKFFDANYGGRSSAGVTVLRTGRKGFRRVVGQSPVVRLQPYFGDTVQFPLEETIPVEKGNVVALTVPTWAPALAVGLPSDHAWRASRAKGECDDFQSQTAQTELRELTRYQCRYRTARLTYTATLITNPKAPEKRRR